MKKISDSLMEKLILGVETNINYSGLARKVLVVDPLSQYALPVYDKIGPAILSIGSKGNGTLPNDNCTKLQVPTFNIFEKIKNINSLDEITEENLFKFIRDLYIKINQAEDEMLISLFEAATKKSNNIIKLDNELTLQQLKKIIDESPKINKIIISTKTFQLMRSWRAKEIDIITNIEILSTGLFAYFLEGIGIYINKNVPDNVIYLVEPPEFTGVMPVKHSIKQFKDENSIEEEIGMAIVNINAIIKVEFYN